MTHPAPASELGDTSPKPDSTSWDDTSFLDDISSAPGDTDSGTGPGTDIANFEPVPVQYRADGWTPRRQADFIEALAETACVTQACVAVGMLRESAYRLRRRPDAGAFREAWDAALALGYDQLEEAALDRAINGTTTSIMYKGERVGQNRRYDERLTVYLLKRRDDRLLKEGMRRKDAFITLKREWLSEALSKSLKRIAAACASKAG